ncbi:unnamed protein product [Polarella glacialis]|uniref:Integrase catalytic domain-containing protein n=1 Tax=Polarella glacialis TaxID=89957 RepID=A0A813KL76_POLGL|nr:unnamed protein product [Polarella glacialis]
MADDGLPEPRKTRPADERADPLASDAKDPWRHQIAELVRLAVAELEKGKKKSFRPKGSLGTAKLEEFYGEKDKYKRWKKVTKAQQLIYQLADEEMSLLLYLACRKDARDTIDVMEVSEMTEKGGLAILWELLDDAFDKEEDEKLDEAEESYYTWRRTPGMTMDRFIQTLKRLKMEYLNQDPESVISAKAFAQRMLQRSGLPHQQRMTVLFNAGGSYEPKEIERVLRRMFNRIAEQDVKTGKTYGALKPPAPGGPPAKPTSTRFKARFRVKSAMMADEVENYDDGEEEEAEQQERNLEENSEDMSGAEDEDDPEFHGALQQAFAAGWQTARKATAGLRKGRQFSSTTSSKQAAVDDPRKKNSVCASCQGKGHWKGDPECPNVVSGKDSPHTPKPKAAHVTSYVGQATEEMYANEVMTATALSKEKIQVDPGPSVEREQDSGKFNDLATGTNLNNTSTASQCQSTTTASTVVTATSGSVKHPPSAEKVMPSQLLQTSRSETARCGRRINFVGVATRTTANAKTTHAPGQAAGSDSMPTWYQDIDSSSDDEMSSKRHREAKGPSKPQAKEQQVKKLEREEEELQQKLKDLQKKKQEMRSSEKDVTERILEARRAKEKLKKPPHPGGDDGDSPDLSSSSGDEDDDKNKKLMKAILKAMKTQEKQKQKDRRASGKTPPASSGASSTEDSMMEKLRRRFKDKMTFVDKEEPTEQEIDLDIRRGIYEDQFQDGIFRVHPKCPPRNDAQKQCKHKFHHLLWGANQAAWWARCGTCGAKHVAYQSKPAFVGMLQAGGEGIYYMDTRPGEALGDSGCRVTVGGEVWHTKMQQAVTAAGGRWQEIEENEYFRFGAGPVVPSKKAIIYPVGFFGKQEVLRMSFVGGEAAECPGLVSPADMGRFKVGMDFGTQRLFVRGVAMPMEWTGSGHPRLYLLDYPAEGPKPLDEQGTMMAQLTHPAYHQFLDQLLEPFEPLVIPAHLASAADEVSDGTSSGLPALTDSSDSGDEGPPPLVDESDSEEEPDGSEAKTSARRLLGEAENRPQGAGSEPEETLSYFSESSHENGWISPDRLSEVESLSEEEAEPRTTVSETFFQKATDFSNGRQFINKGLRKKLRKNLDNIKEVLIKTRQSGYVAQKFLKSWIMHYGVPQEIVHDQGGEFTGEFGQLLDDLAIPSKVTGSHAGFQLAVGERHGGILNNILMAIVYEHQVEGKPQMAMALAAAITAKNSLLKRHGYTPEQAVFGRSLNWAQDLVDEPEDCKASSFQDVGDVATTASMRRTACQAFFRHDLQGKMKRAMQRAPVQSSAAPLLPGTVVYYWLPAVGKGRMRPDPARWRGPATVIAVEDGKKCYISWRGRCLLVTREQLRLASQEEAQSWEWIAKDTAMTGENLKGEGESGHYEDLRTDEGPPARQPEDQRGRKVIKPEKQKGKAIENLQKIKARFDKKKKLLSVEDVPATLPEVGEAENRPLGEAEDRPHGEEGPDAAQEEPDEDALFWKEVNDCEDEYVSEEARRLEREILQRSMLDDVPQSVKRVLANRGAKQDDGDHSPEHKKVRVEDMPDIAMVCAVAGNSTQAWLNREELRQLRTLLRIPGITAARAHRSPRRKLQPATKEEKSRMTIMMTKDSEDVQVLDQSPEQLRKDERTKMPFLWRGVTVFYTRATKRLEKTRSAYVQTPAGLLQVEMNAEERQAFKQTYAQWRQEFETNEVYLLSLKRNGKELDQNQFNETENKAFKESDAKEWEQWVKNNVMKILTPEEAKKVPKEKIFQLPLRMVRTNKAKMTDGVLADLVAKSRLVVPGHVDPEVGEFRTDAPTTHPVAVSLTATIAASLQWSAWTFDVQTAFLSGNATSREVYVRAPKDGLPKVKDERAIRPFELLQILKSAYGLSEAPRLWYLRARELMQQCSFVELACCKATFILVDPRTSLVEVIVCLHVDDGFVVGRAGGTLFETAKDNMNKVFNIKEWICLQEQETDYLGYKVRQDKNFEIHVKPMEFDKEASKEAEREVTDSERHDLLSLVMRLAWPARHCMPQVLYGVSYAAQTVRKAVVRTIKEANKLLEFARHEAEGGRAELHFKAIDLTCPRVITPFDASFANEDGGKSQAGYVTIVTDDRVLTQEAVGNLVEFGSNKIHRVVRSTMAAESAALSIALDKQLYVRMLLEALLYGERSFSPEWKEHMTIPGMVMAQTRTKEFCVTGNMVTDAKSLYDHLSKTGNLPSERQVMLDLLAAKELEEAGVTQIRWVPSVHQLADALTKSMVSKVLVKFLDTNLYSLVQTGVEAADEEHRADLRRGQRQRRKERSKKAE